MIVVIIDSTIAEGRIVTSGETIDLPEAFAQYLISLGRARQVELVAEKVLAGEILTDPLAIKETTERRVPEKRIKAK